MAVSLSFCMVGGSSEVSFYFYLLSKIKINCDGLLQQKKGLMFPLFSLLTCTIILQYASLLHQHPLHQTTVNRQQSSLRGLFLFLRWVPRSPLTPITVRALPRPLHLFLTPFFLLRPQAKVIASSNDLTLWQHLLQQDNDQPWMFNLWEGWHIKTPQSPETHTPHKKREELYSTVAVWHSI